MCNLVLPRTTPLVYLKRHFTNNEDLDLLLDRVKSRMSPSRTCIRRWVDAVQELNHECSLRQGDVCVSCMAALLGCGIEHGTRKNRLRA